MILHSICVHIVCCYFYVLSSAAFSLSPEGLAYQCYCMYNKILKKYVIM